MSQLKLRIFDGARQLFAAPAQFLVTIIDGNQTQHIRDFYTSPTITFDGLPFFDNAGDNYRAIVWAEGYRQAGFVPVKLSTDEPVTFDLMLAAEDPGFNFVNARWEAVFQKFPFLGGDIDAAAAQARYEALLEQESKALACFLNLVEAMGQILLADGTPLKFIQQMRWAKPPQQDRFFAYCDAALVAQVRAAAGRGLFARELNPSVLHPGATNSWKQIQFGEANVQLTFHENDPDRKVINGVECVTLEPDMDYYRDLGAHTILELIPNALTHTLTDPVEVYVLRWIAGQHAGIPQFDPLYTLTSPQRALKSATAAPTESTTPRSDAPLKHR